jgi:hypothetical protein
LPRQVLLSRLLSQVERLSDIYQTTSNQRCVG